MPSTDQLDLAHRLLESDEQVLGDVLRAFGPSVNAVLGRRYRDVLRDTDIEDVISIGLFRLWTSRDRFDRNKASLKVWFFRIVENAARDVLRHGWHKARAMEVNHDPAFVGAPGAGAGADGQDDVPPRPPSALQLELREIVSELSEVQRAIVMADAAARDATASSQLLGAELGIPAATVRVYRKRAMDRIRRELGKRGYDVP